MRRRLLLADDSVTIQRVIELTFADEDIDVVAVSDGDAALARLDADPPEIVLADVGMPGKDGYDVALHVRRTPALAHIPVVLLIGALQPLDEARARESGCVGVLVKPFEPHLVIAKVRELLARADGTPETESAGAPGTTPEPAEAGPAEPAAPASVSVDDYFARLDAAFATIEPAPESPDPGSAVQAAAARAEAPGEEPRPDAAAADEGVPAPRRGSSMVDVFAAMLAMEQGQAPGRLPEGWPSPLVDVVEEIAQRVAEQVAERIVRSVAPDIVSRVSERIVREEIERLRRELASS